MPKPAPMLAADSTHANETLKMSLPGPAPISSKEREELLRKKLLELRGKKGHLCQPSGPDVPPGNFGIDHLEGAAHASSQGIPAASRAPVERDGDGDTCGAGRKGKSGPVV